MRNQFDIQLELLNTELIRMGALCESALDSSIKTLFEGDEELIKKTETLEEDIDAKERDIENLCMKLLLHQQPVAKDLRVVSSAMKMIADMERIGDQAKDIAELSKTIGNRSIISEVHIRKMCKIVSSMLVDSIDAFVKQDVDLARGIDKADDAADECFNIIKNELIGLLGDDASDKELCLDVLMAAKYLERIGDHAVNISELVIYAITGEKYCTAE